jgi:hypothetical protein
MQKQLIPVSETPQANIAAVPGDLKVAGWERPEMSIKTDGNTLNIENADGIINIQADGDIILYLPTQSALSVAGVDRDTEIRNVSGAISINTIGGDLQARAVGALAIQSIGGDLNVRGAEGDCAIGNCGGDASARAINGDLNLGNVGGDLYVREALGNIHANVGADAVLFIQPQAEKTCNINAGSDILLRLPEDANAELSLNAGSELRFDFPGLEKTESQKANLSLGAGGAHITLSAGSDLVVTSRAEQWASHNEFSPGASEDGFSVDIPEIKIPEIHIEIPGISTDINERVRAKIERANERVREKLERQQTRVDAAMRRAEQKMRNAEARASERRSGFSFGWSRPAPPMPPAPPAPPANEPVKEEERLVILRMLEQKKISLAQAEQLLAALEGK